ncbi:Transmembrane domain-containing protein [Spironucleus salmonicida]|uniref:Transmembrane domain-containing protein n=1 Tax=Spironucleus salmonicida TaxID=348837 RepID=V6LMW2_9EUKA|nr:Transmembrane domain-containing protein [Spironucleus salmonicida]|eukprot:EST45558.1 Transmembrane domain-containing protein [Spironucleus salmonicida]
MIKFALASFAITIVSTLVVAIVFDNAAYLPSISEAGANMGYPIYSIGGTISACLLFLGISQFALQTTSSSSYLQCLTIITTAIMCTAFIYQCIVKIDLAASSCPHRTAAGIFFILSYIVSFFIALIDEQKTQRKTTLRISCAITIVFLIILQGKIFDQWNNTNSVSKKTLDNDDIFITKFSLIQYALVFCLFLLLGSILI